MEFENDNKPEPEDASHDNVDDFKEDTYEVCLYDVENVVHSTESNVEVQELFEDDRNYIWSEQSVCAAVAASINVVAMVLGIILVGAECVCCP